jgi:hypothetical protein
MFMVNLFILLLHFPCNRERLLTTTNLRLVIFVNIFKMLFFSRSLAFTMLPDPGLVSVDGVVIGITSVDVLMDLNKNLLSKYVQRNNATVFSLPNFEFVYRAVISSERFKSLARQLLSQRCFYPLYPADDSLPIDVEHSVHYGRMEVQPHILIIPSLLKPFIKDVDGTIVVNPNRLVSGNGGGNYARLQVDFSTANENESFTSIADLCIGQIVKI